MTEQLRRVYEFVEKAHRGQRYGDLPYVTHLIAVWYQTRLLYANMVSEEILKEAELVALLHDVLEDTDCTIDQLMDLVDNYNVIEAVVWLTKSDNSTYTRYITDLDRKGTDLAVMVKYADNMVNLNGDKSHMEPIRRDLLNERYALSMQLLEQSLIDRKIF